MCNLKKEVATSKIADSQKDNSFDIKMESNQRIGKTYNKQKDISDCYWLVKLDMKLLVDKLQKE